MDPVRGRVMSAVDRVEFPDRRVILLGASNIARSLPILFDTARNAWGSPLDIMTAAGHGRSYGMSSRVLGRTLPGILQSELWNALSERPPAPTAALLTDIGNDILYGASVPQIAGWVERCLEQLRPISERVTITQLPIDSLISLGRARFLTMRTILFPKSRLTIQDALHRAQELNERVKELATTSDATIFKPTTGWYGIDPIHIKRRYQTQAWKQILTTWNCRRSVEESRRSSLRWLKTFGIRPHSRHLFGVHQTKQQPSKQFSDGSLVSLY